MNTSAWTEALGWTLIHSAWQATVIAACLWIACLAARRVSPQIRYVAGCLALLATVAVTGMTFVREIETARSSSRNTARTQFGAMDQPLANGFSEDRSSAPAGPAVPPLVQSLQTVSASPATAPRSALHVNFRARFAQAVRPFTAPIVTMWLLGVSLFSIRLWRSWRAVIRLRNSGRRCEPGALEKRFAALRSALGASPAAQFLVSARVRVPMVIGWIKPVVLLPATVLAGLSSAQLEAVLAHELAHIRRHDYLVNLLQNAVETVFFYHPAIWWISRIVREEREHCCDDIAAAATGGALGYVDALAALEQTRAIAPDLAIAMNGGSLLGRARRLLLQKPAEGPAQDLFAGGLVLLAVAALFLIPFALSRAAEAAAPKGTDPKAAPLTGTSANEHFRAFDEVKRGDIWPPEVLAKLPFGPAHATGLRAAWIFRPMREEYFPGDSLACRIIIQNDGADPVEFLADRWVQDAQWSITNSTGTRVTPNYRKAIRSDLPPEAAEQRIRLAPGEAVELATPGVGLGGGDFDEVYGDDFPGVFVPGKAGDVYECSWSIPLRGAWAHTADAAVAIPKPVKLDTGAVKFRIGARDPADPNRTSIATAPGKYIIEPGLDLRIVRVPMQFSTTVNGKPVPSDDTVFEMNWASVDSPPAVIPPGGTITRKASAVPLPDGDGTYVIAWRRGERTLWVGEADKVRRVDLTVAGKFPLAEVLESVDPLEREKLREMAEKVGSGTSFSEKQWTWDDASAFDGMPVHIKAALENHRPKAKKAVADGKSEAVENAPKNPGTGVAAVDQPEPKKAAAKVPYADLLKQRLRVERIKEELNALEQLAADAWPEAARLLRIEDEATRKTYIQLQSALAEEAKLLAGGQGENNPRVKAARAEIDFFRKTLAEQFEAIKRAHRTKLKIEEAQLKTMEEHSGPAPNDPQGRHEQMRDGAKRSEADSNHKPAPASLSLALPSTGSGVLVASGVVAADSNDPWRAYGRVTDDSGAPISDVEIWVHTGHGSLFRTGIAKTDADGRYAVSFRPGIQMEKESSQLQFANVTAHKPGWFEKNLNRQGAGAGAMRDVSKEDLETFKITREQLVLPDKPREVNFVMAKAVTIKGRLLGTGTFPTLPPQDYRRGDEKLIAGYVKHEKAPLARWKVWLTGPVLAPATGVYASAETDAEGRFEFKDVPVGYQWQIQADTHDRGKDPRSPLFTLEAFKDLSFEVEMDEKETVLKVVPEK